MLCLFVFLVVLLEYILIIGIVLTTEDKIIIIKQGGEEKVKIERPNATVSPIWSLQWNPSRSEFAKLYIETCNVILRLNTALTY